MLAVQYRLPGSAKFMMAFVTACGVNVLLHPRSKAIDPATQGDDMLVPEIVP